MTNPDNPIEVRETVIVMHPERNPLAVIGFALSLVWLATSPMLLIDVVGVWEQPPEAVLDGVAITSVLCLLIAPVLLRLGFMRADRIQRPYERRIVAYKRLIIAGTWTWVAGIVVFLYSFGTAFDHAFS